LQEAQFELRRAQADEPARLAYAYTNHQDPSGINPVEGAQAVLDRIQAEYSQVETIEDALDGEIATATNQLQQSQTAVYQAMTALVITSPEYQNLIHQHKAAWQRLRTVKEALRAVTAGLHGQQPQRWADEALLSEPLEPRVGYIVDDTFVNAWRDGLAALAENPDALLPSQV
jgi:chromosome segregation ATPase